MTPFQYSVALRNMMIHVIEATIGPSPTLGLRTGAPPANCATADSGTVLATITPLADWMTAAAAGAKALAGIWTVATADTTGIPSVRVAISASSRVQSFTGRAPVARRAVIL